MLLVFDIDGTLTTNNRGSTNAFRESVNYVFGIKNYSEDWNDYINDSDIGILSEIVQRNLHREVEEKELFSFQECYLAIFNRLLESNNDLVVPVEGLKDFFEEIENSTNVHIALFTGGFPQIATKKLEILGINTELLFSSAFDGLNREKIFTNAISISREKYKKQFKKIVLFGDSESDIMISKKLSIPLVGVTTQLSPDVFLRSGAIATISNYKEKNIKEKILDGSY